VREHSNESSDDKENTYNKINNGEYHENIRVNLNPQLDSYKDININGLNNINMISIHDKMNNQPKFEYEKI